MQFEKPTISATFIKRYKRFFVDARLPSGEVVTAHCANTGSMLGLLTEGYGVTLLDHNDPTRKLRYSLEIIHTPTSPVGVNTARPNTLVTSAVLQKQLIELKDYSHAQREVNYGNRSRIDALLTAPENSNFPPCYVEVKNVTLAYDTVAFFPDSVTERGQKHLRELMDVVKAGHRAVMFYVVQRMDCHTFAPADSIDPVYGQLLRQAVAAGVEVLAYDCKISDNGIELRNPLKVRL
ncbi:MAG: DNA/RNA nuclease SfsA [Alphaproteobacteria bacterium]